MKTAKAVIAMLAEAAPTEESLAKLVLDLVRARAKKDDARARKALAALALALSRAKAVAALAGAIAMRLNMTGPRPDKFSASLGVRPRARFAVELFRGGDVVPVQFVEAIHDLAERVPQLAGGWAETAAEDVRRAYGGYEDPHTGQRVYPHGFALARSLDLEVTKRVQEEIVSAVTEGTQTDDVADVVATLGGWSRSYAQTVVRTNVATAYSAGRLREGKKLQREGFRVGFEYQTAGDSDVRSGRRDDHGENHAALDGIRAEVDDQVWESFSPPGGYNCRCTLRPVLGGPFTKNALAVARERGARFAPGFGSRPDRSAFPDEPAD